MTSPMDPVIDQIKLMESRLIGTGWKVATPVGELATPDKKLWFSATYTSGEYTIHAFHREKGFGVPRGNIRVRLTPAMVERHPGVGGVLADDLIRAADEINELGFPAMLWPRPLWAELSAEGVVDHR